MASNISPPTPSPAECSAPHEAQILSQWLVAQPAYEATASTLDNRKMTLSPDQIDAILSIRKRIAAAQSHD